MYLKLTFTAILSSIIFFIVLIISPSMNIPNASTSDTHKLFEKNCLLDVKINDIELLVDLGEIIDGLLLPECDPDCRFNLYNECSNEKLTMLFYPGRVKNHASYFIVSQVNEEESTNQVKIGATNFVSGKGIVLGQNSETVKSLLRSWDITELFRGDTLLIEFSTNSKECLELKELYNLPLYSAKYYFVNNILVLFCFGFDYP